MIWIWCYYVFSGEKIKFLYNCEIKLKIKGENNYKGNTTIIIKNINNEDEDKYFEYEFEDNEKETTKLFKSEKLILKMILEQFSMIWKNIYYLKWNINI